MLAVETNVAFDALFLSKERAVVKPRAFCSEWRSCGEVVLLFGPERLCVRGAGTVNAWFAGDRRHSESLPTSPRVSVVDQQAGTHRREKKFALQCWK